MRELHWATSARTEIIDSITCSFDPRVSSSEAFRPIDTAGWLAYAVYFGVAWAVFVPSNLGLVNPTLYVLGWQVVEARRNGRREIIICQDLPKPSSDIAVANLMGEVGWVQTPTRAPWTWIARRRRPRASNKGNPVATVRTV